MVRHIVMFSLEGEGAAQAAVSFKNAIEALPALLPGKLSAVEVGINDGPASGNWTLALTADCPDYQALAEYSAAPEHLDCVAIIKPFIKGRVCVDYTV